MGAILQLVGRGLSLINKKYNEVTAYHWIEDSEKWMHGPFQEIDAKYCEQWVTSGAKTLFKTVRALEKREDAAKVLQIARDIKEQIDAFQPYLPIAPISAFIYVRIF